MRHPLFAALVTAIIFVLFIIYQEDGTYEDIELNPISAFIKVANNFCEALP